MPQHVRLAIAQVGTLQEWPPDTFSEVRFFDVGAEYASAELSQLNLSPTKDAGQERTHIDVPRSAVLRHGQAAPATGASNAQDAAGPVHVCPFERDGLAQAEPGTRQGQNE